MLCYYEPSDKLERENLRVCLPISLFSACFTLGHYSEVDGHTGASKASRNAKRYYYWPGMFDWLCALTADCPTCQNRKPQPKHRNEVPVEDWQNEIVPFRTIHIDHKGPLHPPSTKNLHCLLVIDAFSRFLMVFPVTNTGAQVTISEVEKRIHFSEFFTLLYTTEALLPLIPTSFTGQKNWASPSDLEQQTGLGQMAKLKPRINKLHVFGKTS